MPEGSEYPLDVGEEKYFRFRSNGITSAVVKGDGGNTELKWVPVARTGPGEM